MSASSNADGAKPSANIVFMSGDVNAIKSDPCDRRFMVVDAPTDQRTERLAELSMIIALEKVRQGGTGDMFAQPDLSPTTTPSLAATFAHMETAGYVIGDVVKVFGAIKPTDPRMRYHTEWHVQVTKGRFTCKLAFLVPDDVS